MNPFHEKIAAVLEANSETPLDVDSIAAATGSGTTRVRRSLAALEARGRVRKVGMSGRWTTASRAKEAAS